MAYVIFNLYRKIKIYEAWSLTMRDKIEKLQHDIKEIDGREIFETDDEVGFIFEDISNLIKNIDHEVNTEEKKEV